MHRPGGSLPSKHGREEIVIVETGLHLLRCRIPEDFQSKWKRPGQPYVLPDQARQLPRRQRSDGTATQLVHTLDKTSGPNRRVRPDITLQRLNRKSTVRRDTIHKIPLIESNSYRNTITISPGATGDQLNEGIHLVGRVPERLPCAWTSTPRFPAPRYFPVDWQSLVRELCEYYQDHSSLA
jgi:hypothetical protein